MIEYTAALSTTGLNKCLFFPAWFKKRTNTSSGSNGKFSVCKLTRHFLALKYVKKTRVRRYTDAIFHFYFRIFTTFTDTATTISPLPICVLWRASSTTSRKSTSAPSSATTVSERCALVYSFRSYIFGLWPISQFSKTFLKSSHPI